MNHCLLEVKVKQSPKIRYTQDNQTAVAEMEVSFAGLRPDDPDGFIKVVGWGNLAQELQNNVRIGETLVLEGRLRMNTIPKQDGTKEKKAEFTLSRFHSINQGMGRKTLSPEGLQSTSKVPINPSPSSKDPQANNQTEDVASWDSSPLIPDTDEIPF